MTKEEFAAHINGREIGNEISDREATQAKIDDLVVIFGASDDLVELRGAIYEEIGAYGATSFAITRDGKLLQPIEDDDEDILKKHGVFNDVLEKHKAAINITAKFDAPKSVATWTFATKCPHATFDVMEDGDKFCRGIVIDLKELA